MRETFIKILESYLDLKKLVHQPTMQENAKLVTHKLPAIIASGASLREEIYKVHGSVGAGKWTDTPWVSVFHKGITQSAQKGFYIVYLFRSDMQGVYLSLNQGTTYIDKKYHGQKPREKMSVIANNIRKNLNYDIETFPLEKIDLVANTKNAKNYMAAHICGKYYSLNDMPSDETLKSDLIKMIHIYKKLKSLTAGKSVELVLDYYLQLDEIEDIQFQTDIFVSDPTSTPSEPQLVPSQITGIKKSIWKRNPSVAKEALIKANYRCEVDNTHETFISEITKQNFVEAHHLIPMNSQKYFQWSLDVPGNIVSLCPNCHRRIHHANRIDKLVILNKLFKLRKNELEIYGIHINEPELERYY